MSFNERKTRIVTWLRLRLDARLLDDAPDDHMAAVIEGRVSEEAMSDLVERLQGARQHVMDRLRRLGYQPTEDGSAPAGTDLKEVSAQWRIRQGEPVKSFDEATTAVLEALILQGSIPAWDGDGVSCVAQMILAQHDRAERLRSQLASAKSYVNKSIASYQGDPADNNFQRGFLAALEVVRDEAFPQTDENGDSK